MKETSFEKRCEPFLRWLADWKENLKPGPLGTLVPDSRRAAVMSVDMVIGFCKTGPLAGPRVAGIIRAVTGLFEKAHEAGIRHFFLFQDSHCGDAPEFEAFGPHCTDGSQESETIPELGGLPFSNLFEVVPKNSISSAIGTNLDAWLDSNRNVDCFIAVGNCTDLCLYQLAMHLKLAANASNTQRRIIVPADCVETFDVPVNRAAASGILPHEGDLLHYLFLYHMALNGIDVVASIL